MKIKLTIIIGTLLAGALFLSVQREETKVNSIYRVGGQAFDTGWHISGSHLHRTRTRPQKPRPPKEVMVALSDITKAEIERGYPPVRWADGTTPERIK